MRISAQLRDIKSMVMSRNLAEVKEAVMVLNLFEILWHHSCPTRFVIQGRKYHKILENCQSVGQAGPLGVIREAAVDRVLPQKRVKG